MWISEEETAIEKKNLIIIHSRTIKLENKTDGRGE
jgi:hypothetical protein